LEFWIVSCGLTASHSYGSAVRENAAGHGKPASGMTRMDPGRLAYTVHNKRHHHMPSKNTHHMIEYAMTRRWRRVTNCGGKGKHQAQAERVSVGAV